MPYPSVVTTFTNPIPTDKLNSPSHSSIETAQNTGLTEIQTFVGTLASTAGTIIYDVRAAASNGGGHVQTANKGGTGQTSYNKGDLLAASSASVLGKVAVGTNDQALVADSTQTSGVRWGDVVTAANVQNQTFVYANASVLSASVYGITFPTAVSSLTQGQAFAVKFPTSAAGSILALQVSSLTALRIMNVDLTNPAVGAITASMIGRLINDGTQFQLLDGNPIPIPLVSYKSSIFSRVGDAATGSENLPHGLGRIPKRVRVSASKLVTSSSVAFSEGSSDGTTSHVLATTQLAAGSTTVRTVNRVVWVQDSAGVSQVASVTSDATNVQFNWTLAGSPTSADINLLMEVEG